MFFNSIEFLYFFPIITTIYFIVPHKLRWLVLLLSSAYFYATFSLGNLVLIIFIILINFFSGVLIGRADTRNRKGILFISITIHLGILCLFKYYNFAVDAAPIFTQGSNNYQQLGYFLKFPLGLSFITLQSISYIVDVYYGRQEVEKNLGILALFFLFFPKIISGPIERPNKIIPQFKLVHQFDYTRVTNGLKMIVWGYYKKILIADSLALIVNPVYDNPQKFPGISLLVATIAFSLQIFFDFSGYSDIAIGLAHVLGINLTKNFKQPYFASSLSEFWQRWHISLSSWLRDYIFFPIRRNLIKNNLQHLGIIIPSMITMVISGLWHGTGFTFLIWGFLYGVFITIQSTIEKWKKPSQNSSFCKWDRIKKLAKVIFTFSLVSLCWIFFRANTLSDASFILANIFGGVPTLFTIVGQNIFHINPQSGAPIPTTIQLSYASKLTLPIFILIAFLVEIIQYKRDILEILSRQTAIVRWIIYIFLITSLIMFGTHGFSEPSQFIYFKF